jgi:hypothetical protein
MPLNINSYQIRDKDVRMFERTNVIQGGLVLHLDASIFNTVSYGTTWFDLSGNQNNGTITNAPTYNSGNGGTVVFDGVDDIVTLGYKQSLLPSDITQEAWVKASSFVNWHGIISNMASWGTGFSLQIGVFQNIAAMVSGEYLTTSYTPITDVWYHIAATHRSSDNLNSLYVNGVLENTLTRSISYAENAVTTIGVFYTSPGLHFSGNISQVRTYNRALSAAEVAHNYNVTKGRFGL